MMKIPPNVIMSGYPEKEFIFTGEWAEMKKHDFNKYVANRNNSAVYHPIYRSTDGDMFVLATITRRKKP